MEVANEARPLWMRRRYFVQGDYIRHVLESDLERIDPFEDQDGHALHLDLVRLAESDARAVEEFASRWGLLGLFYHPILQVRYGDRWDSKEDMVAQAFPGPGLAC